MNLFELQLFWTEAEQSFGVKLTFTEKREQSLQLEYVALIRHTQSNEVCPSSFIKLPS